MIYNILHRKLKIEQQELPEFTITCGAGTAYLSRVPEFTATCGAGTAYLSRVPEFTITCGAGTAYLSRVPEFTIQIMQEKFYQTIVVIRSRKSKHDRQ
jgi:hypothetical protein